MAEPGGLEPWIRHAINLYEVLADPKARPREIQTPRGLLRFLNSAGGRVLEAGYFVGVALRQELLPGALVLLFGFVFFLSRHSAEVELEIGEKLFPEGRLPTEWIGPRDAVAITVSVAAFFALYMVLAWVVNWIRLVSFVMLAIACIDFNTRRVIGKKIPAYLRDERFAPTASDIDREAIEQRREVVLDFLQNRPHLVKEGARVLGCAIAFAIAVSAHRTGSPWAASAAYVCLMLTLIANEIVTAHWWGDRNRRLAEIDRAERPDVPVRPLPPFSTIAWIGSLTFVVMCAVVSALEGTLTSGAVTMGFINHGGMWGDLVILPLVNGLLVPYVPHVTAKRGLAAAGLFVAALLATIVIHVQWGATGRALAVTDHVFPTHASGLWYRDMSIAGYLHVVYMSGELTLLLAYALTRVPREAVQMVTALLTLHVIVGQVQPAWFTTGTILTVRTLVPTVGCVLIVWIVGAVKMRHAASSAAPGAAVRAG